MTAPRCPVHVFTVMKPTAAPVPKCPRARARLESAPEPFLRFRCSVNGCPRVMVIEKQR